MYQNLLVVIVSYIIYGWWNYNFLFLTAITTLCSYLSGLWVEKTENQNSKKAITIGNIVLNLRVLSFYKYCDFSGYSDIAIGCAHLFVINLWTNYFKFPYFSRNIDEFWRC